MATVVDFSGHSADRAIKAREFEFVFRECSECFAEKRRRYYFSFQDVPLRVGLEKPSRISIPCEASGDETNVGDHDPRLG